MTSTKTITFFLFIFDNNKGITGPDIAIPIAKLETSHPAVDTLTSNASAIIGMSPIKPISVFKIPNTPIVSIRITNLLCFNTSPLLKFLIYKV